MADLEDFTFFEVFGLSNFLQTKVLKNYLTKTRVSKDSFLRALMESDSPKNLNGL